MLRRIVEKAVIILLKKEVSQAAGLLILGCQAETTIHATYTSHSYMRPVRLFIIGGG